MSYIYIRQQCTIYYGIFVIIVGVIGNVINILIFSSDRTYRKTVSTFYYLVSSIISIMILLLNTSMRVVFDEFDLPMTHTSNILCKIRRYFNGALSGIPLCYACLATIDQFFVTSSNIRLRNLSNINWARRIGIIVIIFFFIHGIPYAIFAELTPISSVCTYVNPVFSAYVVLFMVLVLNFMICFIMIIFGYLAYRNIQRTISLAEHGAQKQMTRMICMQVILIVFCLSPYCIYNIYVWCTYGVIHVVNPNSIEYVFSTAFGLLTWANYAV